MSREQPPTSVTAVTTKNKYRRYILGAIGGLLIIVASMLFLTFSDLSPFHDSTSNPESSVKLPPSPEPSPSKEAQDAGANAPPVTTNPATSSLPST